MNQKKRRQAERFVKIKRAKILKYGASKKERITYTLENMVNHDRFIVGDLAVVVRAPE